MGMTRGRHSRLTTYRHKLLSHTMPEKKKKKTPLETVRAKSLSMYAKHLASPRDIYMH